MLIAEHEQVVLTEDLPEHGLRRGDVGVVVMVHGTRGYEVVFVTFGGQTVAVVSLASSKVRRANDREMPHVRPMDAV